MNLEIAHKIDLSTVFIFQKGTSSSGSTVGCLDIGLRLNSGRRVHHEVCCLLLSSLESLQTNLREFSQLLNPVSAAATAASGQPILNNNKEQLSNNSGPAVNSTKQRLANISDTAKVRYQNIYNYAQIPLSGSDMSNIL